MKKFIKLVTTTNVLEVLFLLLLSCTPFLWVGNGWVLLGHDSGFRFGIGHHMQQLWNTWNPTINTGIDWSLYKGFLIIQLPEFILQHVFGSLELAQPFILSFWFLLILMGMYIAVRGFFPERKHWFLRLYTSIFWGFNFYILQGWFIGERAKFSLYAALPLSIYLLHVIFQRKVSVLVGGILFGLLYFFLNGGGSPPLFGASAIVWLVTWMVLSVPLIRKEGRRGVSFSLTVITILGICFLLFNSYWILMQIDLVRGTYTTAVAQEGGIGGLIAWEREISKHTSLLNLLRMQGIPDWYDNANHTFANAYLTNPFLIVLSLFPFLILIAGVIISRKEFFKNRFILLCLLLLVVGLFFSAGSHPPTGKIYLLLMQYLPGFAIFRSSFYKFAPVVWFSLIMLSGFYLSRFIELMIPVKRRQLVSIFVLGILLLYHYPFFGNTFFQFDKHFTTRVQVPEYVKETGTYLQTHVPDQGRVLVLPALDRGFINKPIDTYQWGFYSLDVLPRSVTTKAVIANDGGNETINLLYDLLDQNNQEDMVKVMQLLGITHVLYRGDVAYSSEVTKLQGENVLTTITQLYNNAAFHQGSWRVFATGYEPVASTIKKEVMSISGAVNKEARLLVGSSSAIVRTSSFNDQFFQMAIQAECFYCASNEYSKFQQAVTFPPASSRLREIFSQQKVTQFQTPQQEIDYLLSDTFQQLRKGFYADYIHSLDHIQKLFNQLSKRDQIVYAARISAFLERQKEWMLSQAGISTEVMRRQEELQHVIASHLWISDDNTYKLGLYIPIEDNYQIYVFPPSQLTINANKYAPITDLWLQEGYIQLEALKDNVSIIPSVYFVRKTTRTPSNVLFVYPYSYDTRWKLTNGNSHRSSEYITQGYANGWIVENDDMSRLSVSYSPQQTFYRGLIISGVSVFIGITILLIKRKTLRKEIR